MPSRIKLLWTALLPVLALFPSPLAAAEPTAAKTATAIFAGGCFWCMEASIEKVVGVVSVTSGYIGGEKLDPTYEEVSAGGTGHRESVEVVYDPGKISYQQLLDVFWHNIDPTDASGQFCDHGSQYRSAIFYGDATQQSLAEMSKAALERARPFKGAIVTDILPAAKFYPAEDYHQDYYKKNPIRYHTYRSGCRRDARLKELWGEAH